MNLEQVKKRVAEISKSTATKHPKVLVAELCSVVAALVVEIERIDKKAPLVLKPTANPVVPDSGKGGPHKTSSPYDKPVDMPRRRTSRLNDDRPKNAGDAE